MHKKLALAIKNQGREKRGQGDGVTKVRTQTFNKSLDSRSIYDHKEDGFKAGRNNRTNGIAER
jgi:hypothetical protein